MKRRLCLLLALLLMVSLLPVGAAAADAGWKEAYRAFVLDYGYRSSGQKYFDTVQNAVFHEDIRVYLHDMDGDGTPELLLSTGGGSMADMTNYVYRYVNGRVTYAGNAGQRGALLCYAPGTAYRGVFDWTGNMGWMPAMYYSLKSGSVRSERVVVTEDTDAGRQITRRETTDDGLFEAFLIAYGVDRAKLAESVRSHGPNRFLPMATIPQIRNLGWDAFVRGAAIAEQFLDVPLDAYYTLPVDWAANHEPQITQGTSATMFSPDAACTRGQVVTFLWRAKGCPEPKSSASPFTDVNVNDYYGKAVLWAVENGVTQGMGDGLFAPDATVTRAQVVTFLWRAEGQPTASSTNPFIDVPAGEYYAVPVLWAVANNITQGTSSNTFSPNDPCTRAQIVTFLYRALS